MAAPKRLHLWHDVGASMIAIDTLVHNFLVRTGILARFRCRPLVWGGLLPGWRLRRHHRGGVAARSTPAVQSGFPQPFPRFVQHAIWRFCAQSGLDVCNGNRIDDRKSCDNVYCQIREICDRISLNELF